MITLSEIHHFDYLKYGKENHKEYRIPNFKVIIVTFIFSVNFGTKTDLKHQVYIVQLTKSGKMPKLEKVPEAEAAAMFQICQELPVAATIC